MSLGWPLLLPALIVFPSVPGLWIRIVVDFDPLDYSHLPAHRNHRKPRDLLAIQGRYQCFCRDEAPVLRPIASGHRRPAVKMGREKFDVETEMLEQPASVLLDVIIIIFRCQPARFFFSFDICRARHDQPPFAVGAVAIDGDDRVQHQMAGEYDIFRYATEEFPDRLAALIAAEIGAVPDAVLGKHICDPVRVVAVIAIGAVQRLHLFDVLDRG